jgi:hypothetical protein
MGMIGTICRRLRYMVTLRSAIDDDLEQEIRLHIETRADELEREGVPAGQALAMARREFGPSLRIREDARAEWQFSWFEHLASDVRYSLRALSRNPGFAAANRGQHRGLQPYDRCSVQSAVLQGSGLNPLHSHRWKQSFSSTGVALSP